MSTTIYKKKDLIAWINRNLTQKHFILFTMEKTGSASVIKKKNEKKVTMAFAADAFAAKDDIRDIAFGETPVIAFAVCRSEQVSEVAKAIYKEGLKKKKTIKPRKHS